MQEKDCGVCKTHIYLVLNTESEKEFWMQTKPADIPKGEDWKGHFHNPSWCKKKEKLPPQSKQSSQDREFEEQEQSIQGKPAPPVTMKPSKEIKLESADQTLLFDRSFKLVEMTLSKTRKISQATIPEMAQYENIQLFISAKMECEMGADFQRIARDTFAKMELALDKKLEQERMRYIPED